jgi:hypothetical protein
MRHSSQYFPKASWRIEMYALVITVNIDSNLLEQICVELNRVENQLPKNG